MCMVYVAYKGREFMIVYALCGNVCMLCHSHSFFVLAQMAALYSKLLLLKDKDVT
jgi:hypothetical protein